MTPLAEIQGPLGPNCLMWLPPSRRLRCLIPLCPCSPAQLLSLILTAAVSRSSADMSCVSMQRRVSNPHRLAHVFSSGQHLCKHGRC